LLREWRTAPTGERAELGRRTTVWGCLGMDRVTLCRLPGLSPAPGNTRGVQRQVYVQSVGAARRFLWDTHGSHPHDVSKLLLPPHALAVLGHSAGARSLLNRNVD